jgi:uncharacterized protein with GYD domain
VQTVKNNPQRIIEVN